MASLAFVLLGGYLVLFIFRSQVVLYAEDIEVREVFSTQRVRRSDILAWRIAPTQYISTLELFPIDRDRKKLTIGMTMRTDPPFEAWFASIPNRNAEELSESTVRISADLDVGTSPEERAAHLASARRIGKWLTGVAWAAVVWGWFFPRPYLLAIAVLAALPLIALILKLRTKGLYQIDGRRNDVRPSLAVPFISPSLVLALRAVTDIHFLEWKLLLAWALMAGAVLTFAIANSDAIMRENRFTILAIFLFSLAYAFGALAQADTLFDRSARTNFEATVLSKHTTRGKSTTWYLHVTPWGPQTNAGDISVSRPLYASVSPGQAVCINLASGALKIPWFVVTNCHAQN